FFSLWYGDHRDPHSFPTRRSSDLALAESVNARERQLVHGVAELLVPFFLVGIGMRVDLAIFHNWQLLALSGLVLFAAVISKFIRSEEHTSELQSLAYLVCRLLLEK